MQEDCFEEGQKGRGGPGRAKGGGEGYSSVLGSFGAEGSDSDAGGYGAGNYGSGEESGSFGNSGDYNSAEYQSQGYQSQGYQSAGGSNDFGSANEAGGLSDSGESVRKVRFQLAGGSPFLRIGGFSGIASASDAAAAAVEGGQLPP